MKKFKKVVFSWKDGKTEMEVSMLDSTIEEAKDRAKDFGFVEPKWYKPSTWFSQAFVLTVN